ncbi:MAG: hypothetical protein ACJ77A_15440 [Actinomycetota bacterium]
MILIVLAVVAVAAGAVVFLLKGGGNSPGPGATAGPNTPPFRFQLGSTHVITTVAKGKANQGAVSDATKAVDTALTNMYALAFLDPDHWRKSDYDAAFGYFTGQASSSARRDEATLTLGQGAGDTFSDVQPRSGTLAVRVLTGSSGKPVSSAATTNFTADATKKDGSTMVIKSHATFYLQPSGSSWVIVGYRATRQDRSSGQPAPSAGASS